MHDFMAVGLDSRPIPAQDSSRMRIHLQCGNISRHTERQCMPKQLPVCTSRRILYDASIDIDRIDRIEKEARVSNPVHRAAVSLENAMQHCVVTRQRYRLLMQQAISIDRVKHARASRYRATSHHFKHKALAKCVCIRSRATEFFRKAVIMRYPKIVARKPLLRSWLLICRPAQKEIGECRSRQPKVLRLLLDRLARVGCGLAPPPLPGPLLLPVEPVMAPCARVAAPVAWPVLGPLLGQPGLPGPTDLVLVETPVAPPVLLPLGWAWGWRRRRRRAGAGQLG